MILMFHTAYCTVETYNTFDWNGHVLNEKWTRIVSLQINMAEMFSFINGTLKLGAISLQIEYAYLIEGN